MLTIEISMETAEITKTWHSNCCGYIAAEIGEATREALEKLK